MIISDDENRIGMRVSSLRYMAGGGAELIDIEVGEPGQVQVAVAACGICAWDI
ncbi:hypothetical protein OAF45_00980 [Candidatus Latescibacteria bacterium]|nr:hypothetical protein [Candidatus Latescibacterota bacterium]